MNYVEEAELKMIARLDQIEAEQAQIERALAQLRTSDAPPPEPPKAPRKERSDKGKKRGPRKPKDS